MEFRNTEVHGFRPALHGMRNAFESWSNADSGLCKGGDSGIGCENCAKYENCNHEYDGSFQIGKNDMDLAHRLLRSKHECDSKFMRQIQVWVDMDMPRYFWSELDTYHYNSKNSESTMHKLLNRNTPITLELFVYCEEDINIMFATIQRLEELRKQFKITSDAKARNKLLIRAKRLLPEGFLQMRTVNTNYAELRHIYFQRKSHPLKEEWQDTFCEWVTTLPYAGELIMYEGE